MFKLKPIVQGVVLACGGVAGVLLLGPAQAQQAQQQQQQAQQRLERVEITGTNIRRTDTETVAPVQIITRDEIERSGQPTIADVLKNIPSNSGGAFNEYANSFAPGASSVSLRGLQQRATLVLINGRRVAGYGFAQNIQETFVDLNAIPSSAVERIEILKEGASALYGSDAIAGVVNVILRRDFRNITASAGAGFSEGKSDYRASLGMGFGDLGSDRFNVFGVLDFFTRDELKMNDTRFGEDRDFRDTQAGGRNYTSLTGGGTWRSLTNRNLFRANAECRNPLTYQQAVDRGFFSGNGALPAAWNLPGNTFCTRDFSDIFTVIPESERIGFLGRATFAISSTVEAYGELGFSRNETKFTFQEPFFAGTTGLRQVSPGSRNLVPFPYNVWFAPGASGNPTGQIAEYSGVLNDLGTRNTEITADQSRFLGGLKYSFAGWDLDSAVSYSKSDIAQVGKNTLTLAGTSAAFNAPTNFTQFPPVTPGFPIVTTTPYNLNNPSQNSAALRRSMVADVTRDGTSELSMIDTKATTEIGTLPGGAIGLAVGVEYRKEEMQVVPDERARTGGILGQGATEVNGSRNAFAAYTELALPLTRTLEMQAALRNDSYSDFGTALTPKLGLKFKPSPAFLIRANWGQGFRAPSLPEITPASAFFFTVITEPLTGLASQIAGSISANPQLRPEKSRNGNFGIVFEPSQNFSVGLDFYEIRWSDQVAFPDFQAIADNPNDPRAIRAPAGVPNAGEVLAINAAYENSGRIVTRGSDIDVRYNMRTVYGRFTTRLNASYIDTYKLDGIELAGSDLGGNFLNVIGLPRTRANLAQDWDMGALSVTARVNYIQGYRQVFGSGTLYAPPPATQVIQNGAVPRKASAYNTLDLFARYSITPKLRVSGAVLNVEDKLPPYNPGLSTTYFFDRTLYDIRGRQFRLNAEYSFN